MNTSPFTKIIVVGWLLHISLKERGFIFFYYISFLRVNFTWWLIYLLNITVWFPVKIQTAISELFVLIYISWCKYYCTRFRNLFIWVIMLYALLSTNNFYILIKFIKLLRFEYGDLFFILLLKILWTFLGKSWLVWYFLRLRAFCTFWLLIIN